MSFHCDPSRNVAHLVSDFAQRVLSQYQDAAGENISEFLYRKSDPNPFELPPFTEEGRDFAEATQELMSILAHDFNVSHPRSFGHIPAPAHPASWVGDLIATGYNAHVGGWTLSPGASGTEKQVVDWALGHLGWGDNSLAGGLLVSGGSTGELTALAAARDAKVPEELWPKAVAYITNQTHSSVRKALHVAGIPRKQQRIVPHDGQYRMDSVALREMINTDREAGLHPFVVIGTCGTTNTGAIDPLTELSDICAQYDLWFHVDAAYGGSVLLSSQKHLAAGIERADSVVWDGHKWLYQTFGCALCLVKDESTLLHTYSAGGEYLVDVMNRDTQADWWDLGIELTRPARGPRIWLTLQTLGTKTLSQMVDTGIRNAEYFAKQAAQRDYLELVTQASLAIVTFTMKGANSEERKHRNLALAEYLRDNHIASIFTTELDGENLLRLCTISPAETPQDMDLLLSQMDAANLCV